MSRRGGRGGGTGRPPVVRSLTRGNPDGRRDDPQDMTGALGGDCARWREVVSAELDGEAGADERAGAAEHLEGCAACRAWQHQAAAVTRRARTATDTGPDLVALALVHAPARRRRGPTVATIARAALGAIGLAQLALGLVALLGAAGHGGGPGDGAEPAGAGMAVLGAGMAHVANESAAWNLALGAAFLVGALKPRHLAGLLPALGVFIAVLAVVSGIDLVGGRVDGTRVATHLLLVAGFVVGLLVVRCGPYPRRGPAPGGRALAGAPDGAEPAAGDDHGRRVEESAPDVA